MTVVSVVCRHDGRVRNINLYQMYTARKPPKVPVTVHSRHPPRGGDGMMSSAAASHLQHMAHALQCIVNGDDSAVFPVLYGDLDP